MLLSLILLMLLGCAPEERIDKVDTIAEVRAIFDIDICDATKIGSATSNPSGMGDRILVLDFPDAQCVRQFYDAMKQGAARYDSVDDKIYSRVIGIRGTPVTHFSIDRLSETSVSLRFMAGAE
ncbi:hypothetical protein [Sphingopyxis sp. A083]|uniref:hypothetical protein n=1 Tax=Sphingopyxis sp. A083 TaxID=1759083 RepID=UPI0012E34334|nr:hypothetical protein [Sphingopyxis sp. A083]